MKLLTLDIKVGIYFLIDQGKIVYVGQSVNVHNRVMIHKIEGVKSFEHYSIIECDKIELDEVESNFTFLYEPKYNKKISDTSYCSVRYVSELYDISPRSAQRMIESNSNCRMFKDKPYVKKALLDEN